MRITLTGATGFVGRALVKRLLAQGHAVLVLTRNVQRAQQVLPDSIEAVHWDGLAPPPGEALRDCEALIHLAGENLAGRRWSAAMKQHIIDSRGKMLRTLLEPVQRQPEMGPAIVISASAIGWYGNRGDEELSEEAAPGTGFIAGVCQDWENALFEMTPPASRALALRIGMVLGRDGGALAAMLPVFRLGLGGRLGTGQQWVSWIHLDDLTGLICWALENPAAEGIINATAPEPARNAALTALLARTLGRWVFLPTPGFVLRGVLGEMASLLLEGQRVLPQRALTGGFQFSQPSLEGALRQACGADET